MVTMPTEAATNYALVRELVEAGMDCARINCAHEGPTEWTRMIAHVRRAERASGRRCRIEMDLTGPKIRTGSIQPGPSVLKLRPVHDALGRVTVPASVWLVPMEGGTTRPPLGKSIPVPKAWLARRRVSEQIALVDTRGAHRTLRIVDRTGGSVWAELSKTAYIMRGNLLTGTAADGREDRARVGPIEPLEQRLRLEMGDRLVVTARPDPGRTPTGGRMAARCGRPISRARCRKGCAPFRPASRSGSMTAGSEGWSGPPHPTGSWCRSPTRRPAGRGWVRTRGSTCRRPSSTCPALTEKDLEDLRFIVHHADLVGLSFVHTPSDLDRLRAELARLGRRRMGVVLKLEVRRGFNELPSILLAALRTPPVGVMIARGDLAVEVGFERLAEVQEEILWLCEAAHLPAIWATQVLEGLTKSGLPSRAEVTDAAMGERAECVMLNKGPHIVEAVTALDSILRRMQSHQAKKTAMLRHLQLVERFFNGRRTGARARRRRHPPSTIS